MFQQAVRLDCKMDGFSFAGKVPILDGLTKGMQTMTINIWKSGNDEKEFKPIRVLGRSIVVLRKTLSEADQCKAMMRRNARGESVREETPIAIDFTTVTSVQEDFKTGGTIILDRRTAVAVREPFAEVLNIWVDVHNRMNHMQAS